MNLKMKRFFKLKHLLILCLFLTVSTTTFFQNCSAKPIPQDKASNPPGPFALPEVSLSYSLRGGSLMPTTGSPVQANQGDRLTLHATPSTTTHIDKYIWYKRTGATGVFTLLVGKESQDLAFDSLSVSDSGDYQVAVQTEDGRISEPSDPIVTLGVAAEPPPDDPGTPPPPTVIAPSDAKLFVATNGGTETQLTTISPTIQVQPAIQVRLRMSVATSTTKPIRFKWEKLNLTTSGAPNGTWATVRNNSLSAVTDTYSFTSLSGTSARYRASASNSAGVLILEAVISVQVPERPAAITSHNLKNTMIRKLGAATFTVNATGDNLVFDWYIGTQKVNTVRGGQSSSFTFNPWLEVLAGSKTFDFHVVVSNSQNSVTSRTARVRVINEWASATVSAGTHHTCGINIYGKAYCWGHNGQSQLGSGDPKGGDYATPKPVVGLSADGLTGIAAGEQHTCAIDNGRVRCWGDNLFGQLGLPRSGTSRVIEKIVPNEYVQFTSAGAGVVDLKVGRFFSCALVKIVDQDSGQVQCWGRNDHGELGLGDTAHRDVATLIPELDSGVTDLAVGSYHACAVKNGTLYCWGDNGDYRLGRTGSAVNPLVNNGRTPATVNSMTSGVTQVAAGEIHTCAIKDNKVYCWGNNRYGTLGQGDPTIAATNGFGTPTRCPVGMVSGNACAEPLQASFDNPNDATDDEALPVKLGLNGYSTYVLLNNASKGYFLKSTGLNDEGQLGLGDSNRTGRSFFTVIPNIISVVDITSGKHRHQCLSRFVWLSIVSNCAGRDDNRQLGDDDTNNRDRGVFVDLKSEYNRP